MKVLVIDDQRSFPHFEKEDAEVVYARTSLEGIEQLKDHGPWDLIFWDHDLGITEDLNFDTTIRVFNYFLRDHDEVDLGIRIIPEIKQAKHYIITANPVGGDSIRAWLEDFECAHVRTVDALGLMIDEPSLEELP